MEHRDHAQHTDAESPQSASTQPDEQAAFAAAPLTKVLGRLGLRPTPDVLADPVRALRSPERAERAAAIQELEKRAVSGAALPVAALLETLHDPEWSVRALAALALGRYGTRVPTEPLRTLLRDADESVRAAAAVALEQVVQHAQDGARPLSRRAVATGLTAVGVAAIAGGSLYWLKQTLSAQQSSAPTPVRPGSTQLAFYGPGYAVVDAQGNLYVMDSDLEQIHTRVLKFSSQGVLLKEWDTFTMDAPPLYVVVDAQEAMYATAQGTNTIYKLAPDGALLLKWQVAGVNPVGLALDRQGDLYVAGFGSNTVQKYTQNGRLLMSWGTSGSAQGQFDRPVGVAVDGQGYMYIVDQGNQRVQKLAPTGRPLAQWGSPGTHPGQFLRPGSIAVDRSGNTYVTDGGTGLVQRFSATGKLLAAWGGSADNVQFGTPRGVAVDTHDNIYVTSVDLNGEAFRNGRISKLSPAGTLLAVWK